MATTEDDRLALRSALTETIGEREARVLMEALPPVDYDRLATRDDLDRQDLLTKAEFNAQRAETAAEFSAVRAEMATEFAAVRSEMTTGFARLDKALAAQLRVTVLTHVGSMIGFTALIAGLT